MHPKRKKRLMLITAMVAAVGIAVALLLNAFQQNMLFFFSPAQIVAGEAPEGHPFRIGGMVVVGTVVRGESLTVKFTLTDGGGSVPVEYEGILPDLFREGQGIVARGTLDADGLFTADEVLAKHDENYMPPEVADALKKAGKLPSGEDASMPYGTDTVVKP